MSNVCKVFSKRDFEVQITKACLESSKLGLLKGATSFIENLKTMKEVAEMTNEPEQQIAMLKDALDTFYAAKDTPLGRYVRTILQPSAKDEIFSKSIKLTLAEDRPVSSTFEEMGKASNRARQRNFLESNFKNAPNAKLYFQRGIKTDLVETFLVDRSSQTPRYFATEEEMNLNVQHFKQRLLDRIFAYLESINKAGLETLPRQMYVNGTYTGILEIPSLKTTFNSELDPKAFLQKGVKSLDDYYSDYRDNKSPQDKLLLDAYNAWVMLQRFDTLVMDTMGSIIKVTKDKDSHTGDLNKYQIKTMATNIWRNWTSSDDIENMADVISDVTQYLIETSRLYKWGNAESYPDRYLSFTDFNHVIGKVKNFINDVKSDSILIEKLNWGNNKASLDTRQVLMEIKQDNLKNNYTSSVTFKQVLSRINENPQKHLHVVFDLLCNTDLLNEFSLNDFEKNLIWSLNKEIFGNGIKDTRSLYKLHSLTKSDNIYPIITQVAASTFPEEYLQYYERNDGSIGTRLLRDYALDRVKKNLEYSIQQKAYALRESQYAKYGMEFNNRDDDMYLGSVSMTIPVNLDNGSVANLAITARYNSVDISFPVQHSNQIWNDSKVQQMFRDLLGINFEADPDLKNAYTEELGSARAVLQDLGKIVGRVSFNAVVNNKYLPKHKIETKAQLRTFIQNQFNEKAGDYTQGLKSKIPLFAASSKSTDLHSLAMATAMNNSLLSSAQSKTGEGTSLANFALSRMRNFYPNQIEMQGKRDGSAVKDLTFVTNKNGMFLGILSRREFKTLKTNQQSTKFSDHQSFKLGFIKDFVSGFVLNPDTSDFVKNGQVSMLPTVNSDKVQIDGLLVQLKSDSRIANGKGGFKHYMELTDAEIEQEMSEIFAPMYNGIIHNINQDLYKVVNQLSEQLGYTFTIPTGSEITTHHALLGAIESAFINDASLGTRKKRVANGLHKLLTKYNKEHFRNPIQLAPNVHYIIDKNGSLQSNKTLEALWGRFAKNIDYETEQSLLSLYKKEAEYADFMNRNGLTDAFGSQTFFKYKDYLTAKDLIEMGFNLPLFGSDSIVRQNQKEVKFLRGQMDFTETQLNDPDYKYLVDLNSELQSWVDQADGKMVIAKGYIKGNLVNIKTVNQLKQASNITLHPMLSKLNRLDYLTTQQYVVSTVGSHYAHSAKPKDGYVLTEESNRWASSNKRNVAATSTVHLYQKNQLNGAPSVINMATIDDATFDLYSVMGDLYKDGHKPMDGCMLSSAWVPALLNNSLAGERAGNIQKPFGTFYNELLGAGGIVKTASFPATNDLMRNHEAWRNLQKAMSSRPWIAEYGDADGKNVVETTIDITKNYFNEPINYEQVIKGPIMYKRPDPTNPSIMVAYKLDHIEYLGNNQYRIYEVEIDSKGNPAIRFDAEGNPISGIPKPRVQITFDAYGNSIENDIVTIDNNWALFTEVFGGYNSLELNSDGNLTWSENSNVLMVYAMNNVGYRKNFSSYESDAELKQYLDSKKEGLDQTDIWQPLKYSDIHLVPNIGAIKSLQYNVNPDCNSVFDGKSELNHFTMRLAQFGIQLDKEHHADAANVSFPTQLSQAAANKSYTYGYTKELYTALSTLTHQAIEPFLDGIKDIITAGPDAQNSQAKLVEEVTNIILDNLMNKDDEDSPVNAILKDIQEKADKGQKITYVNDIKGKIAWSDPTIMSKLFSTLSTTLSNIAIKVKFPGSLSIICPTDPMIKLHGDRTFSSFESITNIDGSTRTESADASLLSYQKRVKAGQETDSDGNNMLVFDLSRDLIKLPVQDETESVEDYQNRIRNLSMRQKLSKASWLKTQHNYVIEFEDGSEELITINTPEDYFRVKNLIVLGKKSGMFGQETVQISKIYEDVTKGRALSAYNVRFKNKDIFEGDVEQWFQIYDLDSINLLFTLNNLILEDQPKGYENFLTLKLSDQQSILNKIFKSPIFQSLQIAPLLSEDYPSLPSFDESFIDSFNVLYPEQLEAFITKFYNVLKPRVFKHFQKDLFKLSPSYNKEDRSIYVNGELIQPMDIKTDAYELIMPKIYKTQFGLREYDDLQEILRDKEFFVKRGLTRFACKFSNHNLYDYELKNFNGEHVYILDKSKGIPEELQGKITPIEHETRRGKTYRVDIDGKHIYELSSKEDFVCKVAGVEIIVTDNPLFYVQNMNYNTLKTSPTRVTEDSYTKLLETLSTSKRVNSKNFLKAISTTQGQYFDLKTFKEFNEKIDAITYETIHKDDGEKRDFKSVAQLCNLILQNGRELHTAFEESLNLIAGRIPAQSQQSFMPQRVVAFDNVDRNTAYVSTFQLFLQGSDLDIDAVTLLGYDFDKNGKFIGWSPYFDTTTSEYLEASKQIPLPTGKTQKITASPNASSNFFEVYDKYMGTLFKTITNEHTGGLITQNGVPKLQMEITTPEGLALLAEFLRDFNKYGIHVKAELNQDRTLNANEAFFKAPNIKLNDGTEVETVWNLFKPESEGGLNAGHDQTYQMALQLLEFTNDHNNYINTVEDYLRDGMAKNYIVHYLYKVSSDPSNQTECQESIDKSTAIGKNEASKYTSNDFAPGSSEVKYMSIGEGQAGKEGVGIGATATKANSTTQYYLADILATGTDNDLLKIWFRRGGHTINGKTYKCFSNMYTSIEADQERANFAKALELIASLESPDQVTRNVATNIGSLLSLAVDNAKDLALKKINSGPRSMGMYAYGLTLGIPLEELVQIINSTEGKLLVKMTEGCMFNNDVTAFRLLDVFDKLSGNIGGEINRFKQYARNKEGRLITTQTDVKVPVTTQYGSSTEMAQITNSVDALYAAMYLSYEKWFTENGIRGHLAENLSTMVAQLIQHSTQEHNLFKEVLRSSDLSIIKTFTTAIATDGQDVNDVRHIRSAINQLISYIEDISDKSIMFNSSPYAKDLRTLSEGAEEMRVLGAILSINKGLKATIADTETFIDMIENLIWNRKEIMGITPEESDKIDFEKFMTSVSYQNQVIENYEKIKHSVNIPHLISRVEHFKGYLTTQIVPISFFTTASVKYRTLNKYRKNINSDVNAPSQSLFDLFGVDSKRDKDTILRGLENLIQFKMFTRWAYDHKLTFKVPKGFAYFTKKTMISSDPNYSPTTFNNEEEVTIPLYTEAGLATFKKYMEEYYIPQLQNDPTLRNNEFIKNLTPHMYDKTPLHNEVSIYTLSGDLMAKKGRQAELNQRMFSDFQRLAHCEVQPGLSLSDAFYLYSQYCYMGRKGQTSLMALFDNEASRSSLCNSFSEHVANMDVNGNISCSKEELIIWCAPVGTQYSNATYAYVTSFRDLAISLKQRVEGPVTLSEEDLVELQAQMNEIGEEITQSSNENYTTYNEAYLSSHYDQIVRDYFLVPNTNVKVSKYVTTSFPLGDSKGSCDLLVKSDMILDVQMADQFKTKINEILKAQSEPRYKDADDFIASLKEDLTSLKIPYKVSLYKNDPQQIDLGIIETIIDQKLNC